MSEGIVLTSIKRPDDVRPVYDVTQVYDNAHIPMTSPSNGDASFVNAGYENDGPFVTESSGPPRTETGEDEYSYIVHSPPQDGSTKGPDTGPPGGEPTYKEWEGQEEEEEAGPCLARVIQAQKAVEGAISRHGQTAKFIIGCLCLAAYACYFAYAISRGLDTEDQIRLLWITCFAVFLCCVSLFRRTCGDTFSEKVISPITGLVRRNFTLLKWGFITVFLLFVIIYIVVAIAIERPRNLISLMGLVLYVILVFVFSSNPGKVDWRPVCWGLGIQFVFALLILRTSWGFQVFKWLGDRVREFLVHTDAGSIFVFGETYEEHMFAFKVLPVVVFFSTAISVLYYLGVMQVVILKLAWVFQRTLGTTAAESINASGNIFIGMTETPLLIRPFVEDMTRSELHAVMTGGFATIAGTVMASYILFGVQPSHLITASVMAAPCALAMSKLCYPETQKAKKQDDIVIEKPPQQNMIEAASAGASGSIVVVANIAANLIAFMAMLAFVNATLQWIGNRVGMTPPDYPSLTFQLICSYVLWPFAFVMGVDVSDCRKVGELIGFKVFINEFVAYTELGKLISNREIFDAYTGPWHWINGDILLENTNQLLVGGVISARTVVISTYALCGFANVSSIGLVLGSLGAMSDKQKPIIAQLALRAMLTGNIVCFMNACTAGLLYQGT